MRKMVVATALLVALMSSPALAISPNAIPSGSTIYIEPHEGFENYLRAALQSKSVPLAVVLEKEKADFVLISTTERGDKPGWSQTIFLGKTKANEDASVTVVNAKTSVVAFAYSVHKYNAVHGQQSTAESIAKNLKKKIGSGK